MNSTVVIYRLLLVERLSRELAELVGAEANHADTPDKATRPERISKTWNEIVRHVGVIEAHAKRKPSSADETELS
jgi:hypothetical protein